MTPEPEIKTMRDKHDPSKKLAPLFHRAFRQGVDAAARGDSHNPYVQDSHLYHAWNAGWASLARGWCESGVLRVFQARQDAG